MAWFPNSVLVTAAERGCNDFAGSVGSVVDIASVFYLPLYTRRLAFSFCPFVTECWLLQSARKPGAWTWKKGSDGEHPARVTLGGRPSQIKQPSATFLSNFTNEQSVVRVIRKIKTRETILEVGSFFGMMKERGGAQHPSMSAWWCGVCLRVMAAVSNHSDFVGAFVKLKGWIETYHWTLRSQCYLGSHCIKLNTQCNISGCL